MLFWNAKSLEQLCEGQDNHFLFVKKVKEVDCNVLKKLPLGTTLAVLKRTVKVHGFSGMYYYGAIINENTMSVTEVFKMREDACQYKQIKNPSRFTTAGAINADMNILKRELYPYFDMQKARDAEKAAEEAAEEAAYQQAKAKREQEKANKRMDLFKRIREEITATVEERINLQNAKDKEYADEIVRLMNNLVETKCQEFYQLATAEIDDKIEENNQKFYKLISKKFTAKPKKKTTRK